MVVKVIVESYELSLLNYLSIDWFNYWLIIYWFY
jgi:hypothetical protein